MPGMYTPESGRLRLLIQVRLCAVSIAQFNTVVSLLSLVCAAQTVLKRGHESENVRFECDQLLSSQLYVATSLNRDENGRDFHNR